MFSEFPEPAVEQWIAQVVKDLKGERMEDRLMYDTPDGITVKPFYTKEDLEKYAECRPLFSHSDWDTCVKIDGTNEAAANKQALYELNNGADALLLFVYDRADLATLLDGVGLEYIAVQFVVEGDAVRFRERLHEYLETGNTSITNLRISINTDPLESLLRTGDWRKSEEEDKAGLITVSAGQTLCINGNIYHNAGAPPAYEIACLLAHANQYLSWSGEHDMTLQLNVAVGPDYFFEIAKLRALRKVFALLLDEYGMKNEVLIHAETATRNFTLFDAHNNLLRATTSSMAAVTGGCNSLVVKPFDMLYQEPNAFSARMARNIQLILKHESYFDKVADVSAGSFFIEELTEQLAARSWEYFTGIEKEGGFLHALKKGTVQEAIRAFAAREQAAFDEGKTVLVGTNRFPDPADNKQAYAAVVKNGTGSKQGKIIETLSTVRLSAAHEKARLQAS